MFAKSEISNLLLLVQQNQNSNLKTVAQGPHATVSGCSYVRIKCISRIEVAVKLTSHDATREILAVPQVPQTEYFSSMQSLDFELRVTCMPMANVGDTPMPNGVAM